MLSYDRVEDVLIRDPTHMVFIGPDGANVTCFFKLTGLSFRPTLARQEIFTHKQVARVELPPFPETSICPVYRIVCDGSHFFSMLFT